MAPSVHTSVSEMPGMEPKEQPSLPGSLSSYFYSKNHGRR